MSRALNILDGLTRKKRFSSLILSQIIPDRPIPFDMATDRYTRKELSERIGKIRACSDVVELREYPDHGTILHNANFCKNPIVCPTCAERLSRRRKAIWKPEIKTASKTFNHAYLITYTIQGGDNLKEQINNFVIAKKRFRKYGQRRGTSYSGGEFKKVKAALSSIEIKIGEGSGKWHVHSHDIVFTDDPLDFRVYDPEKKKELKAAYGFNIPKNLLSDIALHHVEICGRTVPASKISLEWYAATRGAGISIDVSELKHKEYYNGRYYPTYEESIAAQCNEVLKYNSQLITNDGPKQRRPVSFEQFIEMIQRRGGRRLFNSYRGFRLRRDGELTPAENARLEYVESLRGSVYDIYAARFHGYTWNVERSGRPLFADSDPADLRRRSMLSEQGRILGAYRRTRAKALEVREYAGVMDNGLKSRLEAFLDGIRDSMKQAIKDLWHNNDNGPPPFDLAWVEAVAGRPLFAQS